MFRKTLASASCAARIGFLSIFQKASTTDSTSPPDTTSITEGVGYQRVVNIFRKDETGNITPEWGRINQTAITGFIAGSLYGGFQTIKENTNKGIIGGVAAGSYRWGFKMSILSTTYIGIITIMSTYRGESSIYEYIAAMGTAGGLYAYNRGIKTIGIGVLSGVVLGLFAGGFTLLLNEVYNLKPIVNHNRALIEQQITESNSDTTVVSSIISNKIQQPLEPVVVPNKNKQTDFTKNSWNALDDLEKRTGAKQTDKN